MLSIEKGTAEEQTESKAGTEFGELTLGKGTCYQAGTHIVDDGEN